MSQPPPLQPARRWERGESAPALVYHYTSAGALLAILKCGTLRATEFTGLNDYSEITTGQAHIVEEWVKVREAFGKEFGELFLEKVSAGMTHLQPEFGGLDGTRPYVFCASNNSDDANQWRLYANSGRGFAIALDTTQPFELVDPSQKPGLLRGQVSSWRPVLYHRAEWDKAAADILEWIRGEVRVLKLVDKMHPIFLQRLVQEVRAATNDLAARIKTPGFEGERESRLIVSVAKTINDDRMQYHENSYGIVRSVNLEPLRASTDAHPRLPIQSLILGPAQNFALEAPTIRALLAHHGYPDVEVLPSQVSLR